MCFSGGGPSAAENRNAAEQRVESELAQQDAAVDRAEDKREDITDALSAREKRKGMRGGGKGRRSLYSAGTGSGFLSRFG